MTEWGWRSERTKGIWRYGAGWIRPFAASAPALTVALLLVMFHFIGGTMTAAKGLLFDLPGGEPEEGEQTQLVALVMPLRHETMVFFDDTRYLLDDAVSTRLLGEQVAECVSRCDSKTLLALVDRRVPSGELMRLAALFRQNGVQRLLFAEKTAEAAE